MVGCWCYGGYDSLMVVWWLWGGGVGVVGEVLDCNVFCWGGGLWESYGVVWIGWCG